jgi:hypothetical protein
MVEGVGRHRGRPHRAAIALAVLFLGSAKSFHQRRGWRARSVATANWLTPPGMATPCARQWVGSAVRIPGTQVWASLRGEWAVKQQREALREVWSPVAGAGRYGVMDSRLRGNDETLRTVAVCWGFVDSLLRRNNIHRHGGWLWRQAGANSRLPQRTCANGLFTQPRLPTRAANRERAGLAPRTPGGPANSATISSGPSAKTPARTHGGPAGLPRRRRCQAALSKNAGQNTHTPGGPAKGKSYGGNQTLTLVIHSVVAMKSVAKA